MLIFGILTKGFGLPVLVLLIGNPRNFTSKVCSLKALFFFFLIVRAEKKNPLRNFLIK